MSVPLIIAAHGTRVGEGVAQCEELAGLVAERLLGVPVTVGYVELAQPTLAEGETVADLRAAEMPDPAAKGEREYRFVELQQAALRHLLKA